MPQAQRSRSRACFGLSRPEQSQRTRFAAKTSEERRFRRPYSSSLGKGGRRQTGWRCWQSGENPSLNDVPVNRDFCREAGPIRAFSSAALVQFQSGSFASHVIPNGGTGNNREFAQGNLLESPGLIRVPSIDGAQLSKDFSTLFVILSRVDSRHSGSGSLRCRFLSVGPPSVLPGP